jgi:hypothetical protein
MFTAHNFNWEINFSLSLLLNKRTKKTADRINLDWEHLHGTQPEKQKI